MEYKWAGFFGEKGLEMADRYVLRNLGVRGDWGFSFVESKGASGGIIVAWDESVWSLVDEWKGNYSLSTVLSRKEDESCVIFSGVYGPSLGAEKKLLWEELNGIRVRWNHPWCIGGDFKEIRFVSERLGCRRSVKNMRVFDKFIAKNDLIDLPLSGSRFTWSRGESQSRIDRFLICPGWLSLVPEVIQRSLVHSVSDHCPIILDPRMES
ncbi:uncharacterized protein LOC143885983 [Tasmannia lanceolata]|uniref:uncharacterized protein LOC143885983 n=1 Tax=Tasmannia lanceolata TaxID=3420 RepID=UPI0040634F91